MNEAIIVFLVFTSLTACVIVIGLIVYLAKRLEHKQIMKAIEKGTPLSELRPPKPKPSGPFWIRYFTIGIALLTIGLAWLLVGPGPHGMGGMMLFVAFVLCGIGLAWLIRGLLYRKHYLKSQLTAKNNAAGNTIPAAVPAPGTLPQANQESGPQA